jgi:hypothetical protein
MAPIRYNEKAQVAVPPTKADFRKANKQGVMKVAAAFVNSAVKRKHVERSYDLATPALRAGYTRVSWSKDDIPVQPYPLDFAKYQVKGSFTNEVWLQVALFPDHAHDSVPSAVFDLVLKPSGKGAARHWLVDSWAPAGYEGIPSGPLGYQDAKRAPGQVIEYKGALSGAWLLVPLSAFGVGLLLLAAVAARGWWRSSRAMKRYKRSYL